MSRENGKRETEDAVVAFPYASPFELAIASSNFRLPSSASAAAPFSYTQPRGIPMAAPPSTAQASTP